MVGASIEVVFPCPFVFERHELVDIDCIAVDQSFFGHVDPFARLDLERFVLFKLTCILFYLLFILLAAFTAFFESCRRFGLAAVLFSIDLNIAGGRFVLHPARLQAAFIDVGCRFFNLGCAKRSSDNSWSLSPFSKRACTSDGVFCRLVLRGRG